MPALDADLTAARRFYDLNFISALEMLQAFAPMLIASRGCVINNASVGGFGTFPFGSMYGSSKAALIQGMLAAGSLDLVVPFTLTLKFTAGEAWRHELAPLGVRVLTLVTGGVATKFLENLQPLVLPPGSYYAGIKDIIEKQEENISFGQEPAIFAKGIVRRVERGETGKAWVGGGAVLIRWVYWFAWWMPWIQDWVLVGFKPFQEELEVAHERRMKEEQEKL
jgi:1-acylglycerone phosphate reductase